METRLAPRLRGWLRGLALAAAWAPALAGAGTGQNWNYAYAYQSSDTDLEQVLLAFAKGHGLALAFDHPLDQPLPRLNGWMRGDNAAAFLDKLALAHHLRWFVFNDKLYVSPASDNMVERLRLGTRSLAEARQALTGLGLLEARFGWGELPEQGVVLVSGPSRYVALVKELALDGSAQAEPVVMVFRLRHALAADREVVLRDQRITLPGVATLLRNVKQESGKERGAGGLPATSTAGSGSLPALLADMGNSLRNVAVPPLLPEGESGKPAPPPRNGGSSLRPRDAKGIEADPRTNSVIIRDDPSRRPHYEKLIAALDVQQRLIEIEAVIIEFDHQDMPKEFEISQVGDPNSQSRQSATKWFLASLDKYERSGRLHVVSRQRVITPENLSAVIDISYESGGSGDGNRGSAPPRTGSMMRMTPRLVDNAGTNLVNLAIDMDQGNVVEESGISAVMKNVLNTQAVIPDGSPMMVTTATVRRGRTTAAADKGPDVKVKRRERAIFVVPRVLAKY